MKILEKSFHYSAVFAGIVLFVVAILITVDTIVRAIFVSTIPGVYEITEVSFLILSLMAFGLTQFRDKSIRIDVLANSIKNKTVLGLLDMLNSVVVFIFALIILRIGVMEWINAVEKNYSRAGIVRIPSVVHLSFFVIGSFLLGMSAICSFVMSVLKIRSRGDDKSQGKSDGKAEA